MDLTKIESPKFSMPKIMQMPVDLSDSECEAIQQVIASVVRERVKDYTSQWLRYMSEYTEMLNITYTESSDKAYAGYKKRMDRKYQEKMEEFTERTENVLGNLSNLVWLAAFRDCGLSSEAIMRYIHAHERAMETLNELGPLALTRIAFDDCSGMVCNYSEQDIRDMEQLRNFHALDMKAREYYDAKKRGTLDEE